MIHQKGETVTFEAQRVCSLNGKRYKNGEMAHHFYLKLWFLVDRLMSTVSDTRLGKKPKKDTNE